MELGKQFSNVFDLGASRKIKQSTGKTRAVRSTTPESPELEKRANQAIELNKPVKQKKSIYKRAVEYLALDE